MKLTADLERRGREHPGTFRLPPPPERPCSEHPGWPRDACRWCAGDGESHATAGYRLSVAEKKRIKIQTGQDFEDHGQYKAWCRAETAAGRPKRDIERGEPQDVVRRDMDEWYRDTGGVGPEPHSWKTAKGGRQKPIPTPWREEG